MMVSVQKEAKAFFPAEPAGMTRSTLNLTVLDSGLQQEVHKSAWHIAEMLVPRSITGKR